MAEVKRTPHECPICKEIIYNDVASFHAHLSAECGGPLFSVFPELRDEPFNVLWYKLTDLVQQQLIVPSGRKGVAATVHRQRPHHGQRAPPQHQQQHHHQQQQQQRRRQPMDLEALDRNIDYLRDRERHRQREQAQQRKRYRRRMEQEIRAELENDELSRSMPRRAGGAPQRQKRRLLYHNTSDIRPPKRVNTDPEISVDSLRHKIREQRREYHNVSMMHCAAGRVSVDQKAPVIHTQRALTRYLGHCRVLRKCFHGELFRRISSKFERVSGQNHGHLMAAVLREIKLWRDLETESEAKPADLEHEAFLSSWDAVPQQTESFHLDKLLANETLSGRRREEPVPFWNASNNAALRGFDRSIFDGAKSKKFVTL